MEVFRRLSKSSSSKSGASAVLANTTNSTVDDKEASDDFVVRNKAFSFISDYQQTPTKSDGSDKLSQSSIHKSKSENNINITFNEKMFTPEKTPAEKDYKDKKIAPSYRTKKQLKSVLIQSTKAEVLNVNDRYNRARRYDAAGKYRIGPSFITKNRLAYLDENKPAKLSVVPEQSKSLEFGMLTYLSTFTDQHDKQEIDLSFLQSLIDSDVEINYQDQHGQTLLHAIVRDWHPDVAVFALRNNANVNAQDKNGRTPLHLAAALNCVDMVRQLLLHGGKPNIIYHPFS